MNRYDFSLKLERAFVEYADRRADEKGLGKGEFAHQVWPEDTLKAAASRWSAMRSKATNTGKPQGLLMSDAHRMASVLGINLGCILTVLEDRITEGRVDSTHPDFIKRDAEQLAEIKQGLLEADAGDFATEEEMAALDAKRGYRAR